MQANNKAFEGGQNWNQNQCKETNGEFLNYGYQGGHGGQGWGCGAYRGRLRWCNIYGEQGHWLHEPLKEIPKFNKNEMANTIEEIKTNEKIGVDNKNLEVFEATMFALDLNKDNDTN